MIYKETFGQTKKPQNRTAASLKDTQGLGWHGIPISRLWGLWDRGFPFTWQCTALRAPQSKATTELIVQMGIKQKEPQEQRFTT